MYPPENQHRKSTVGDDPFLLAGPIFRGELLVSGERKMFFPRLESNGFLLGASNRVNLGDLEVHKFGKAASSCILFA